MEKCRIAGARTGRKTWKIIAKMSRGRAGKKDEPGDDADDGGGGGGDGDGDDGDEDHQSDDPQDDDDDANKISPRAAKA